MLMSAAAGSSYQQAQVLLPFAQFFALSFEPLPKLLPVPAAGDVLRFPPGQGSLMQLGFNASDFLNVSSGCGQHLFDVQAGCVHHTKAPSRCRGKAVSVTVGLRSGEETPPEQQAGTQ